MSKEKKIYIQTETIEVPVESYWHTFGQVVAFILSITFITCVVTGLTTLYDDHYKLQELTAHPIQYSQCTISDNRQQYCWIINR